MAETLPLLLKEISERFPESIGQFSKDGDENFQPTYYPILHEEVMTFGAGLLALGSQPGDHIGLISENRKEWLIADLGILSINCADVPRGCDATPSELSYIINFSETKVSIFENRRQLAKLQNEQLEHLKLAIIMDNEEDLPHPDVEIVEFRDVMERGRLERVKSPSLVPDLIQKGKGDDLATLIFTSGTTGEPKGVMLSHRNFLHQVENVPKLLTLTNKDRWLCVLPVWHSFERIMQYVAIGAGSALAYSKPIGKIMLADMMKVRPSWMASVPRIWESVKAGVYRNIKNESPVKRGIFHFFVAVAKAHAKCNYLVRGLVPRFSRRIRFFDWLLGIIPWLLLYPLRGLGNVLVFRKIREKLGGNFVAGISGGGALPKDVDEFFAAAGILLLEGYGLTETAPVLGVRAQEHPVPGTIGPVFPGTVIQIRDEENKVLPPGSRGIVWAKGPQVMKGYYRRTDLTKAILSDDGWLNTGDLGMLTHDNELKILGRVKDTIVLVGGENVEPLPIEQKLQESPFIHQAMVIGQDQKFLGALIVPDGGAIEEFARENSVSFIDNRDLIETPEVNELINSIIQEQISPKNGFKTFERVFRFALLAKEFELGDELSAKQEIKRHVIAEKYAKQMGELFR